MSGDRGVYIYAITHRGVEAGARRVECEGLQALVADVRLDEFRERLEDRVWLEEKVRAHEHVLSRALAAPLLPMRFGTVVSDEEEVRSLLRGRADAFRSALERVAGRREWGAKVYVDRERLLEALRAREAPQPAADGAGRAFFARKRLEQAHASRVREEEAWLAARVHEQLAEHAVDAVVNAVHARRSDSTLDMVLNGAYLVPIAQEASFAEAAHALEREADVVVELTGPWPAYNFVAPADVA